MQNLFEGFKGVSLDQWKEQIAKDLRGVTFEELTRKDDNGITIFPVYNNDNSLHRSNAVFSKREWSIASFIDKEEDKELNETALHDLNYGAQSLIFVVSEKNDPDVFLNNISIEHIQLNFVCTGNTQLFTERLNAYLKKKSTDLSKLKGAIISDPVNSVVRGLQDDVPGKWNEWKDLVTSSLVAESAFTAFVTDGFPYHNAGATAVTELACILAHLNEQLHYIRENKIETKGKDFFIIASASINFFETVSKFRALRKLAAFLLEQYGLNNNLFIHANNSLVNKTVRDPWNNLVRSTIEGMAAVTGGADSLFLFPYDFVAGGKDRNGRRLALDQQLIFKEEALLAAVADEGAGAYFLEEYTYELCEKAWEKFKSIEKKNGIMELALNGGLKKIIGEEASQLKKDFVSTGKVLIGVNKFTNEKDKPLSRVFSPAENKKGLGFFIAEQIIEEEQLKATNA